MTASELLAIADGARGNAYAPYSRFAVGAALEAQDGRVFTGVNVENASYGLSMCAERVALYRAVADGALAFAAVAVSGPDGIVTMPCGACRQVLHEFGPQLQVIHRDAGIVHTTSLATLLPGAFGATVLDAAAARGAH